VKIEYDRHIIHTENGNLLEKEEAQGIREAIKGTIADGGVAKVVALDFSEIDYIDLVIAKMLVVDLLLHIRNYYNNTRRLLLINLTEQHIVNIQSAINTAQLCLLGQDRGARFHLFGALGSGLKEVLRKVVSMGGDDIRSSDMQQAMRFDNRQEASAKLSRLHNKGLLFREPADEGGYLYSSFLLGDPKDEI